MHLVLPTAYVCIWLSRGSKWWTVPSKDSPHIRWGETVRVRWTPSFLRENDRAIVAFPFPIWELNLVSSRLLP